MKKIKVNKVNQNEIKEIRKKAWSLVAKKNMIPLAVGLIIGSAFSLLVNALANDVVNQALAKAFGYRSLAYLSYGTTKWERVFVYANDAKEAIATKGLPLNGVMYGKFLSALVSFIITTLFLFSVAFISYFIIRRFISQEEEVVTEKEDTTSEKILLELKALRKEITTGQTKKV